MEGILSEIALVCSGLRRIGGRFGSEHPVDVLGAARACLCASILSRELHISSMWSGRSSRGLVRRLGGWFGDWGAVSASLGPGDPSHRASMSLATTGCRGFDVGG